MNKNIQLKKIFNMNSVKFKPYIEELPFSYYLLLIKKLKEKKNILNKVRKWINDGNEVCFYISTCYKYKNRNIIYADFKVV